MRLALVVLLCVCCELLSPGVISKKIRSQGSHEKRSSSGSDRSKRRGGTHSRSSSDSKLKKRENLGPEEERALEFAKKCKSAVPNNFSPSQTEEFCSVVSNSESLTCVKDSRSGSVKLTFDEVMSLCKGARTNYPLECFKSLASKDRKMYGLDLCPGIENTLPLQCWKTITMIAGLVRKVEHHETVSLCRRVISLTQLECVRSGLKQGRLSLSKAEEACQDMSEARPVNPDLDMHIDSLGNKVDDDSYNMCRGRLSSSAEWSIGDANTLCRHAASPQQVDVIIQCVIDIRKSKKLSVSEISRVCQAAGWVEEQENYLESTSGIGTFSRGRVASCVHKAFNEITTSSSMRTSPEAALVISACQMVRSSFTGTCIASFSNRKMQDTITPHALLKLCTSTNNFSKLSCLKKQQALRTSRSRGPITPEEVQTCISMKSQVQTLRIERFESSLTENPQEILAGHFFSLSFSMIDQWDETMSGSEHDPVRVTVEVERSHINDPGAVLFGSRKNTSEDGVITFSHLMVSQPGPIQLKIIINTNRVNQSSSISLPDDDRILLYKFLVHVSENPEIGNSNQCLFVFESIQSPSLTISSEVDSWLDTPANTIVGRLSSSYLISVLACIPVFASWAVTVHIAPVVSTTHGVIIDVMYRSGIDSVWTGHGLPRAEMSPYARLDIPVGCMSSKLIRGAYHKKSLKWHPDRWASIFNSIQKERKNEALHKEGGTIALYKLAVQEAFELIAEAYEELLLSLEVAL